ncbi:DNA gyrase subunit A [Methanocella paludicola SANAE]|uniref:DNA gyrase subunit A n=1 Tax=Methanocella paludicola (strain DSM 17711 / JCM 13418 / NBRC 101707 / SANAE) TaxID=304371 RepID=D1YWG1_METPS|nr:DNA gyrase subunit A [Methanocella paludicola]BAI60783.1 DNA gyrase subunit A [Methanocella paludicola SANAE]
MATQETVLPVKIEEEMRKSYIDYAMSVIVGRALPDVRDGLKPVHRRVLYGMYELGNTYDKPYKKSARVVGDVMGKYHPHGDMAIYDTIVRMVQDFSLRYPLIDGQGNFGSVDGDSAAAMRYTEVRMAKIADEMLDDLDKETVNFVPNFDESLKEPSVLPAKLPNLLINGSSGIAVGMATNIPPHNISEVIDGTVALINDPAIEPLELLKLITGPDFPTGAYIYGREGIKDAYLTGRGSIKIRAKAEITEEGGRNVILVTEIPYMVNKAKLIENIADLVRDKKLEGISDLRDESDRDGMRIVIELKKGANANVLLNQLYRHTQMETTFGVNNLALVDNQPRTLSLKETLEYYLKHRQEVVTRRSQFELKKAQAREHILAGLLVALDNIDDFVNILRRSASADDAKAVFMSKYGLSEEQSKAILDMRLRGLTGLERRKIEDERAELIKLIAHLKEVLASPQMVLDIIKNELLELRAKYGDGRRTIIKESDGEIVDEDLIPVENVVVTISNTGYIKRQPVDTYRTQRRGGMGIMGMETKEEDFVVDVFTASTHDHLLFFTNKGRVYVLKVYEIPEASRQSRGKAIVNLLTLMPNESVNAMIPIKEFDEKHYLIMCTREGTIKKTALSSFQNIRRTGIIAIGLDEGDELISVKLTNGGQEVLIATRNGKANRFSESEVRPMGRQAGGVIGIRLTEKDKVIGMEVVSESASILTVCENGFGKRTAISEYTPHHRGGQGMINIKTTLRNGGVVAIASVTDDDQLLVVTRDGIMMRINVKDISEISRNTQGVKIITLKSENDAVVGVAKLVSEKKEEEI